MEKDRASRGHLVQSPVQSRINLKVRSGCSRPCPAEFWKYPKMEIPQLLWLLFCTFWKSLALSSPPLGSRRLWLDSSLVFSFSRLSKLSSLHLFSYVTCFSPQTILVVLYCTYSSFSVPCNWMSNAVHSIPSLTSWVLNKRGWSLHLTYWFCF